MASPSMSERPQSLRMAAGRIGALAAWRRGCSVAALLSAALLACGALDRAGALAGLGVALSIAVGVQIVRRRFVASCALDPDLVAIPAVRRARTGLCSRRRRRALCAALRRTAQADRHCWEMIPVTVDRLDLVCRDLLAIADDLESSEVVDPRTLSELRRLLCDGRESPLLNERLPAPELVSSVRCARYRLATPPRGRDAMPPRRGRRRASVEL
jgi:hypothetical protein